MEGLLSLSNGLTFKGKWNSRISAVQGEIVFFTGMTGYEEVLTDPSYKGQIIVFSYPLIGQYGIQPKHAESGKIQAAGIVVAELYNGPVEKGALPLAAYAENQQVPILSGIDTRSIIQHIREYGTMQSSMAPAKNAASIRFNQEVPNFFSAISAPDQQILSFGTGNTHIGLVDFHYKSSIAGELLKRDCQVSIIPYNTSTGQLDSLGLDGLLFSNGPGDPAALAHLFPVYRDWAERYPSFGICLGHQVLASAFGASTEKLTYGHRGANHPVVHLATGRVSMSSQNHSYVVTAESLAKTAFSALYKNVNDGSIEGLIHTSLPVMTVQFHPEAAPGPADHTALFDQFIAAIQQKKKVTLYA